MANSLLDKNKLTELYIGKNMKMLDIAKELDVGCWIVRKELKRFGIPIRKRGYGFNIKPKLILSNKQHEFFDGLMAGDGSICRRNSIKGRKTKGNDFLSCGFKYKEFAEYIVDVLNLNCKVKPYTHISERYISGECSQFKFLSENNEFFTQERDRWYPGGTKAIPPDFRFSPVAMNMLFLCDGWSRTNDGRSYIATDAFTYKDISIIVDNLEDINIRCKITKNSHIYIKDNFDFLTFIGDCPVECYRYKWSNVFKNKR